MSLADLAALPTPFYIGDTKCGALLGEAVVFPKPGTCPHFFTLVKRRRSPFSPREWSRASSLRTLLDDGLYQQICAQAVTQAARVAQALQACGLRAHAPAGDQPGVCRA
ncbi:MAG: hypothetical protein LKE43_03070 [Olsenella sp.]|nr:hypothetical protein [Olsenella sp.]